jgi:hypothetical protein
VPTADRGLPSTHEQCLLALRTHIRALGLPELREDEVEVRENWFIDDRPYRGITISEADEASSDGVVGMQDVGYLCAVTLVTRRDRNAKSAGDVLTLWRSAIRRRFQNQRVPIGTELNGGVVRQICRVFAGRPTVPRSRAFADWSVKQLIVAFWVRETPDDGE